MIHIPPPPTTVSPQTWSDDCAPCKAVTGEKQVSNPAAHAIRETTK